MKTIIIDDEPLALELLSRRMGKLFPDFKILKLCKSGREGILEIERLKPELVFIDIEMPEKNGFMVLDEVGYTGFIPIFVSAYDSFGIKAIKYGAVDYLLKPVEDADLIMAVRRAEKQFNLLHEKSRAITGDNGNVGKIALPYQNGVALVSIQDIVFCEADNNYTHFYTIDNRHYTVVKALKTVQEALSTDRFLRIHRQFLVNLKYVKKINKGDILVLTLVNGKEIPISRSQKDELMKRFNFF